MHHVCKIVEQNVHKNVCLISVLTRELILNSPCFSISSRSPAAVGCITGLKWLLTGQISRLRKTMI